MRQQRPTTPYVPLFHVLSPPTRPSCVPKTAYNPIRFTLPNALTLFECRAAGLLLIQFTKNHTRHWLNIASTQAINFAKYPPSQRHSGGQTSSLQLPSPLPSADACQRVIKWIKVPAILECVFSGQLISKLISHTSEAGSDSTNCDKGVFKSHRLPPLSLKQG